MVFFYCIVCGLNIGKFCENRFVRGSGVGAWILSFLAIGSLVEYGGGRFFFVVFLLVVAFFYY